MSSEINAVIENLCETLGTTAERLIPELVKAQIAKTGAILFMCLVAVVVTVLFFKWAEKKSKHSKYNFFGYIENCCAVPAFFIIVADVYAFIAMICTLPDFVTWIASPTGSAVIYILEAIGG